MSDVKKLYIFDGFDESQVSYFLLMSQSQYRKSGERIMTVGDPSNGCAYYVIQGKLRVIQGGKEVAILEPGAFF